MAGANGPDPNQHMPSPDPNVTWESTMPVLKVNQLHGHHRASQLSLPASHSSSKPRQPADPPWRQAQKNGAQLRTLPRPLHPPDGLP